MSYHDTGELKLRPGAHWVALCIPEDVTRETDPKFMSLAREGRLWWFLAPPPAFRDRRLFPVEECPDCKLDVCIYVTTRKGKRVTLDVRTDQEREDTYKGKTRTQNWMLMHSDLCKEGATYRERSYEREKVQHADKAPFTGEEAEDPLFGGKDDEPF